MKYLCQSSECLNEIHPCIDGFFCNICKVNLLKSTMNDINSNLPIEICDIIYYYANTNNKIKQKKCIRCKKYICIECSKFYMPWCCICYDTFNLSF